METISEQDNRLEHPADLEYCECDECGEVFQVEHLNRVKIGRRRACLCAVCLDKVAVPAGV